MEDEPLEGPKDIFRGIKDTAMHYNGRNMSNNSSKGPDAECILCLSGRDLRDTLNIIRELSKHQFVGVTWLHIEDLERVRDDEYNCQMLKLLIDNFCLSSRAKSVQIKNSCLLFDVYSCIMTQLVNCPILEKLILTENSISADMKRDKIVASLISLKELDLKGCDINAYNCEELMEMLW